jgi:diaminopimelate epimerase
MSRRVRLLPFVKMEGAGNDYVYVDAFVTPIALRDAPRLARRIADRHHGIGADGLILLAPSRKADCRMLMWNADGSRGAMCGNGLRCLGLLARHKGLGAKGRVRIETDAGVRLWTPLTDRRGAITGASVEVGPVRVQRRARELVVAGRAWRYHAGDAGNPHAVVFLDEHPDAIDVAAAGEGFQRSRGFRDGVNVEFVQVRRDGSLAQRTFERGSGETLACGSGACVAAKAAVVTGRLRGRRVRVRLRGGDLTVVLGRSLVLQGPARTVFTGLFPME